MVKYSIGIYWNNVRMDACLIRTGSSELAVERVISMPREHDEHYIPKKAIAEEIPLLIKDVAADQRDTFVVSMPEMETTHRSLLRPFGDRKKIAQTIAPEVETLLPFADGNIIVDYVLLGQDEAGLFRIETIAAGHESVDGIISGLKAAGIDPTILDSPSAALLAGARNVFRLEDGIMYLFLDMGWHTTSLALLEGKDVKFLGAFPFGFEKIASKVFGDTAPEPEEMEQRIRQGVEAGDLMNALVREVLIALSRIDSKDSRYVLVPTGYARSLRDLPERFRNAADISTDYPELKPIQGAVGIDDIMDRFLCISLAIRGIDRTDPVNFRKDDLSFARRIEWVKGYAGTWIKVAAVLAVLWLFGVGLNISLNAKTSRQLTQLINKEFSSVMPGGTPMVDPVKQMEQQLARMSSKNGAGLNGEGTPLEVLRDISMGIPSNIDVVLDNIFIDESSITISGNASSYDNVERIKEKLSALPYVAGVKIVSANVDKNDSRVRLKLVCGKKSKII